MKRSKLWWSVLQPWERSWLVDCEHSMHKFSFRGGYLPDDCYECNMCGQPMMGIGGLCRWCNEQLYRIVYKADRLALRVHVAVAARGLHVNRNWFHKLYARQYADDLRAFAYDR